MPSDFHSWPMSLFQQRQPTVLSVPFQKYFMHIHKCQSFLFNLKAQSSRNFIPILLRFHQAFGLSGTISQLENLSIFLKYFLLLWKIIYFYQIIYTDYDMVSPLSIPPSSLHSPSHPYPPIFCLSLESKLASKG